MAGAQMETHPPEIIETIVERLIPPPCREHVMGDLYERYRSPRQYIVDAALTIPFVVASQVRRQSDLALVVSEACGLYISFTAASMVAGLGYLYDHSALVPLVIVVGFALLMLVVRDAYTNPEGRSPKTASFDSALAMAFALLSQAVLRILNPNLMLPPWITILGGSLSLLTLGLLRAYFRPGRTDAPVLAGGAMTPLNELHRRSQKLHKKAWRLNLAWLVAILLVVVTMPDTVPLRNPRVSFILLIVIIVGIFAAWLEASEKKR